MFDYLKTLDPLHRLFLEACFVGIVVMLVGLISSKLLRPYFKVDLPEICRTWNKKHIMEISLFTTGFLAHILLEVSGINKDYALYKFTL